MYVRCRPACFSILPSSLAYLTHCITLGAECVRSALSQHKTPMCSIIMFFRVLSHIISPFSFYFIQPRSQTLLMPIDHTQGVTILKRRFPDEPPSFCVLRYANRCGCSCYALYETHAGDTDRFYFILLYMVGSIKCFESANRWCHEYIIRSCGAFSYFWILILPRTRIAKGWLSWHAVKITSGLGTITSINQCK